MKSKLRRALAAAVCVMPTSSLRKALYTKVLGYSFGAGTRIGWGTQLAVDSFAAGEGVVLSRGNLFVGPIKIVLGDRVFFGRNNRIECGDAAASPEVAHMKYTRTLIIGDDALVNDGHLFDVLGTIHVGKGTWVAGFDSQFLTHGASAMNRDIRIGEKCFLGSAVRFAPGAIVGDRVVVAMGAVVAKQHREDDVVLGGVPSKVIKQRSPDDQYVFNKTWE
ncbi:MAG: hypothetical protein JWN04_510 [Myxococcaceae bacterium]|nr:hypothetical protein [Myxococcaceae bacterium]